MSILIPAKESPIHSNKAGVGSGAHASTSGPVAGSPLPGSSCSSGRAILETPCCFRFKFADSVRRFCWFERPCCLRPMFASSSRGIRRFEHQCRARVGRVAGQSAKNRCALPNSSRLFGNKSVVSVLGLPSLGVGGRGSWSHLCWSCSSGLLVSPGVVVNPWRLTECCSGPEHTRFQGRKGCRLLLRGRPAAEHER